MSNNAEAVTIIIEVRVTKTMIKIKAININAVKKNRYIGCNAIDK